MAIEVRSATERDAMFLVERMREADRLEVSLSHGHTPEQAVLHAMDTSRWSMSILRDGDMVCMFGVGGRMMSLVGSPWMLGTDLVDECKRSIAMISTRAIPVMAEGVKLLENWVHADNVVSIKWLTWLGFTIEEPRWYGNPGGIFRRFTMEGQLCAVQRD